MGACLLNYCRICKKSFDEVQRRIRNSKRGIRRNNYCENCYLEYQRKQNRKYKPWLKFTKRRKQIKLELIENLGGKCQICGYDDLSCPAVFDFHHVDYKTENVGKLISKHGYKNIKIVLKELKGCIAVCANCHRKIHNAE